LHAAIYGMGEAEPGTGVPLSTHSHDPENPHPTAQ
jgi:hypothetical protein